MRREDATYQAADVAAHIIGHADDVNNLRLQKLLYLCQREHVRRKNAPLFSDRIVAWQAGPIVESVYYAYAHHGASVIDKPRLQVTDRETLMPREALTLDEQTRRLVNDVMAEWNDKSVWDLINETHKSGGPWDVTYNEGHDGSAGHGREITLDAIARYDA